MLASSGLVSTAPLQLRIAARPIKTRIVVSQSRTTTIDDPSSSSSSSISMATAPRWAQKTITLPPQTRGCHLVTSKVSYIHSFLCSLLSFLPSFLLYTFINPSFIIHMLLLLLPYLLSSSQLLLDDDGLFAVLYPGPPIIILLLYDDYFSTSIN